MPDYIKIGSDRPDFTQTLRDDEERPVDLRDASNASLLCWDPNGNLLINDTATIDTPTEGAISYDLTRDQIVAVGTNEIEVRVDWDDGDKQWFPADERAYELEVVTSPGDRDTTPPDDPAQDAEVNRLTVHDAIEADGDELEIADSILVGGDITVTGSIDIAEQLLDDDQSITYGTDGDFETYYDPATDRWRLVDETNGFDAFRADRQGNVIFPSGDIRTDQTPIYDSSEGRVGVDLVDATSINLGISPTWTSEHKFAAGANVSGGIEDDGLTIYNPDTQTIPASVVESDEEDGSFTVSGGKGIKNGGSIGFGGSVELDIEPNDFTAAPLQDDGSDNIELSSGGITSGYIADGAVSSDEIANGGVEQFNIASDAVGESEIDITEDVEWTGIHDYTNGLRIRGEGARNVIDSPNLHVPMTTIPDGDFLAYPIALPPGSQFDLWMWGVTDAGGGTANVGLIIRNDADTVIHGGENTNPLRETGDPLFSADNTTNDTLALTIEIHNTSSSDQTIGAYASYTVA